MPTVKEQRDELIKASREIVAKAEAEGRDLTDDERSTLEDNLGKIKELAETQAKVEESEELRKALADLGPLEANDKPKLPAQPRRDAKGSSIGATFVGSDQFAAFKAAHPNGISDHVKGIRVDPVEVPSKSLITGASATSAGAMVVNDYIGEIAPRDFPVTILDLVTRGTTSSDTVEFARETTFTNAAAPVAEATTQSNGAKPESTIAWERVSTPVETIAHWIAVTKRALADAGQLRTWIDTRLRFGLQRELEDQIVNGDGNSPNMDGILNISGIESVGWDTDLFTTVRKGITVLELNGSMPTAVAVHPEDAERVDLERDGNDRFFGNGPFGGIGPTTLWGLPVVKSIAVPRGQGILGDWSQAYLWDREQAMISATDSHDDFFTKNLVAVLAELRAAFTVVRPDAFAVLDLYQS